MRQAVSSATAGLWCQFRLWGSVKQLALSIGDASRTTTCPFLPLCGALPQCLSSAEVRIVDLLRYGAPLLEDDRRMSSRHIETSDQLMLLLCFVAGYEWSCEHRIEACNGVILSLA